MTRLLHSWSGIPSDLEATDLLFTSLLVQATRRITALGNDPTFGPAFPEAVVPPIVLRGLCREDRVLAFAKPTRP